MKTPRLAAFLAVLFGTTACAETFDDPSKEQEVNGSYSWTLSGDSTVKYVSSPQDNPGTLDIGAYTLNMAPARKFLLSRGILREAFPSVPTPDSASVWTM